MKLNKIQNDLKGKLWCGIAALSAITGNKAQHSKDCIRLAIDEILNKTGRTIKGIYTKELLAALDYLIIDHKQIYFSPAKKENDISLARFLHGYKPVSGKLYLVVIPGHFLVTDGNQIMDNMQPNGCPLYMYPYLDETIIQCHEISDTGLDNL